MKQTRQATGPLDNMPGQPRRFYMAGTGRFITKVKEEEWLNGESAYGYAENNPVTYTDPSGLAPQTGPGGITTVPGRYPVANPCNGCGDAILRVWFPHPAHMGNHKYAHCMACCVLNFLGGSDCALGKQTFQNLLDVYPLKGRVGRIESRYQYCLIGLGIVVHPPESFFGACQKGCQREFPMPPHIPPFPYLPQCDPTNYEARKCPAGTWDYVVP